MRPSRTVGRIYRETPLRKGYKYRLLQNEKRQSLAGLIEILSTLYLERCSLEKTAWYPGPRQYAANSEDPVSLKTTGSCQVNADERFTRPPIFRNRIISWAVRLEAQELSRLPSASPENVPLRIFVHECAFSCRGLGVNTQHAFATNFDGVAIGCCRYIWTWRNIWIRGNWAAANFLRRTSGAESVSLCPIVTGKYHCRYRY